MSPALQAALMSLLVIGAGALVLGECLRERRRQERAAHAAGLSTITFELTRAAFYNPATDIWTPIPATSATLTYSNDCATGVRY